MSIEDIIKRGFKNQASYSISDGRYTKNINYLYSATEYSFRLKDKGDVVIMELKTTAINRELGMTTVMKSYHGVQTWSKQKYPIKYPIGINSIPYESMMVMKFSDGSIARFDRGLNFVEIAKGNDGVSKAEQVSTKEPTPSVKEPSEVDMKALDRLIDAALEDFVVTDEERATLLKKADSIGLTHDEFKMILDSRIQKRMKEKPEEKIEEKKKGFFARLFGK